LKNFFKSKKILSLREVIEEKFFEIFFFKNIFGKFFVFEFFENIQFCQKLGKLLFKTSSHAFFPPFKNFTCQNLISQIFELN